MINMTLFLKRILNLIVYGGSRSFESNELIFLDLAEKVLPESEKETYKDQLNKVERIKRYNDGRMLTFQFDGVDNFSLFTNKGTELCLVRFKKGKKILGALISHRGRLSSLELKVSPKSLQLSDLNKISAEYLSDNPMIAESIDNEEHQ